jgi:hypothetical protein
LAITLEGLFQVLGNQNISIIETRQNKETVRNFDVHGILIQDSGLLECYAVSGGKYVVTNVL